VLSKASIPLIVLPLLTFAITVVTQCIMLLLSTVVLLMSGVSAATLWTQLSLFQMSLLLFYHLLTVPVLWHAPIYAWLLLVPGGRGWRHFYGPPCRWSQSTHRRENAFNTSHFLAMLAHRLSGGGRRLSQRR